MRRFRLPVFRFATLALTCAALATPVCTLAAAADDAPPAYDLREHYTKYEYRIPMRDGVRLFTAVYLPKDASVSATAGAPAPTYPFLMLRTPYFVAPYGADEYASRVSPSDEFAKSGYIFVVQDVRGRGLSEGTFVEMTPHRPDKKSPTDIDESSDTSDTIDWLLKNVPHHNGRVGLWGISYPGFYVDAGIIDSHPAIKAASPQAPVTDLFLNDDAYHGGALMLAANFGFYTFFKPQTGPTPPPKTWVSFDFGTQDAYEFYLKTGPISRLAPLLGADARYWADTAGHPTYDAFWQQRAIWRHLKNIHCAVLTVGGWFDAEDLAGPLRTYRTIEDNNPGIFNALVMGPWVHGGWAGRDGHRIGAVDFAADTAKFYNENILFPFFEQHLKDAPDAKLAEATVFETGTNVWRQYPSWPPPGARKRTLYFHPQNALSFEAPSATPAGAAFSPTGATPALAASDRDTYVSDPAKPVPFIGYTDAGVPQEFMVSDQRFAATRPDVLVYTTAPLDEDVTIVGPVSPHLFVSTTGTDADWVVKLIDVYPPDRSTPEEKSDAKKSNDVDRPGVVLAGYQQLVRGDPFRGRYRHSPDQPGAQPAAAFVPNQVEAVAFTMSDLNHTFRRGHRIMVQVQSSWFPLVDRNPQTFVDIPTAKPEDFRPATHSVYHSATQPSGVEVFVLPAK